MHKVTCFAATIGLILATIANLPHSASAANRDELWVVVHDICVPAYQSIGVAFPCAEVSIADGLERGFAVLRAPSSATHVIVVPTMRISGIESPALLSENAPNYWEAAWDARRFVEEGARRQLPRDKIGMAINSAASRSQDQLHIHVACIAPKVAEFLRRHQAEIHRAWSFLSSPQCRSNKGAPGRDPLSEGFRHFASGWSGRRVGLAPTGKRRLFTAHTPSGPYNFEASGFAWSRGLACRTAAVGLTAA